MPPSGYTREQSDFIKSFLSSCVEALEAENSAYKRTVTEGLRHEISGIDSVLETYSGHPFALQTLLLTREFYKKLLELHPCTSDELRAVLPQVLSVVVSEITSVHVDALATAS